MRWTLLVIVIIITAPAFPASTRISGNAKSYLVATRDIVQSQNSVRVMIEGFGDANAFQLHAELSPVLSSRTFEAANATLATNRSWRLTDPPRRIDGSRKHDVFQNLDRLNWQFNLEPGDLTIGRQPITFGMARIINPTDVFLPFDIRTFNTEYRIGVDAIRFQRGLGQLGEVDFGVITGDGARSETSAAFFQLRTNVDGRDLQFSAIRFAEQNLIGGGMQSTLGEAGFWFEGAWVSGDTDYARVSTGLDYAFSEDIYGLVEYHFNGAGSDATARDPELLRSSPYRTGGVFLLGRHYLIGSVTVQLSPLWSLGTQATWNLSDDSAFTSATATWNARQNLYIDLGVYAFSGDSQSEFGTNPETLYASLRFYF